MIVQHNCICIESTVILSFMKLACSNYVRSLDSNFREMYIDFFLVNIN